MSLRPILFFIFLSVRLAAQNPTYTVGLKYINDTLQVEWKLNWVNTTDEIIREIPLVFLPKGVSHKQSFYRKEKIEDQNKTLHFKKQENITHIVNEHIFQNHSKCQQNRDPVYAEATWVELQSPLGKNDTLSLHGFYDLHIGSHDVIGWRKEGLWLQHLIHHIPQYDSGWHITPLNRHANYQRRRVDIDASFDIPIDWKTFTNLTPISNKQYSKKNTHDFFAIIGPDVVPKQLADNWTVYNHDPFEVGHIYALKLKEELGDYLKTYLRDGLPPNYIMVNPSEPLGYCDPGCGVVFLPHHSSLYTSQDAAYALSILQTHTKSMHSTNFFAEPWAGDGFSRFLRDDFVEKTNRSVLLSSGIPDFLKPLTRLFPVGNFPLVYQNHIMYYYLARQGLDQPAGNTYDNISAGNYLAIVEGKTSIGFHHLRGRVGKIAFYNALQTWKNSLKIGRKPAAELFQNALNSATNKDTEWFFTNYLDSDEYADYHITKIQKCSYVYAVTVNNRGRATIPYPLTGMRNDQEIITIWYDGHRGKKTVQFHLEDYDEIILDHRRETVDLNPRNNRRKESGVFRNLRPVTFQLYTDIEHPEREQVFVYPIGGFNAYDGLYGGISFYNRTRITKRWEYRVDPTFSTRTQSLTGSAALINNMVPSSGWFHRITSGVYFHHYHYDTDLAYYRFSPFMRFWWKKSHPRSEDIHRTRLRYLQLERETNPQIDVVNASYRLLQLTHDYEHVNILRPCSIRGMIEVSDAFSKVQIDIDQRWMLPNKKWISTRFFAGAFMHQNIEDGNRFFDFGMSGTLDYAFDYYLLGRSETEGVLSQQMIMTDGGFKSQTNTFASQWLTAFNTYVPIWSIFGVFGDIGFADDFNTTYWGYGIRIAPLTDFFEIYLPIQNYNQFMWEHAYPREIRFMLNIDMNQIVQRVRRGWY